MAFLWGVLTLHMMCSQGHIVYADVKSAFEKLGVSLSEEEIGQVFQESDMLENGKLTFKEFLVCLVIGFVLQVCAALVGHLLPMRINSPPASLTGRLEQRIPAPESEQLSIFYAPLCVD